LTGSGELVVAGPGFLVLGGSNDYSGGTVVEQGTLEVVNVDALGGGTSLTVGAGAALLFNTTARSGATGEADMDHLAAVPEPGAPALLLAAAAVAVIGQVRRIRSRLRHAQPNPSVMARDRIYCRVAEHKLCK
jgi:autotransporter-associated beta strand protein